MKSLTKTIQKETEKTLKQVASELKLWKKEVDKGGSYYKQAHRKISRVIESSLTRIAKEAVEIERERDMTQREYIKFSLQQGGAIAHFLLSNIENYWVEDNLNLLIEYKKKNKNRFLVSLYDLAIQKGKERRQSRAVLGEGDFSQGWD